VIRILIVDDHGIVREGLQRLLDSFADIIVAGAVGSGEEAVEAVATLHPDVVLMDLEMPDGIDGAAATRRILSDHPSAKVLILTAFSDRPRILRAIDAGAMGYVLKDGPAEDLVRSVRAAARGEFPIDPKAARVLMDGRETRSATDGMSARELEVLSLIGLGLPNKEIARRLDITERTVKGHLTSIFREIGVSDRTQAALWAQRNGVRAATEP
jgi:DNA-binding NarL/FixJ family response regulator